MKLAALYPNSNLPSNLSHSLIYCTHIIICLATLVIAPLSDFVILSHYPNKEPSPWTDQLAKENWPKLNLLSGGNASIVLHILTRA